MTKMEEGCPEGERTIQRRRARRSMGWAASLGAVLAALAPVVQILSGADWRVVGILTAGALVGTLMWVLREHWRGQG